MCTLVRIHQKILYSRIEAVQNFYTLYQTRGTNQSMENLCERLICPCIEFYYIIHYIPDEYNDRNIRKMFYIFGYEAVNDPQRSLFLNLTKKIFFAYSNSVEKVFDSLM